MEKKKEKISYLAEHATRSDLWDIKEMLNAVLRDLRDDSTTLSNPQRAILIMLDDKGEKYDHVAYTAKMRPSEIISLLSVVKQLFIKDLV